MSKKLWTAGIVVGLFAIGGIAGGGQDKPAPERDAPLTFSANENNPPAADVTVSECEREAPGIHVARLAITNRSSKASDYVVDVEFLRGSVRVAQGAAVQSAVRPGQRATTTAMADQPALSGSIICRVVSVNRVASLGG